MILALCHLKQKVLFFPISWREEEMCIRDRVYQLFADYFLGCGVAAGRFVFGDHIDRRPNFSVACNAVDQTRFYPNAAARTAIRAQYGITGTERLAGFVGRLNHQKNPLYLIRVFAAMVQPVSYTHLHKKLFCQPELLYKPY